MPMLARLLNALRGSLRPPAVAAPPSRSVARQGRPGGRPPRRLAIQFWCIIGALAALTLTACAAKQSPTGSSPLRGSGVLPACPTPTAPAQASAPPTSPPVVKGAIATTGDGLQEIDVQVGCGTVVQVGQTVIVEYTGWVQGSGKLFDSSFEHQPSDCEGTVAGTCSFALVQGSVIQGWVEGVAGMKVGGTRRLIIPPALAYGDQGAPPAIPPNATLIFDITVVGVQ